MKRRNITNNPTYNLPTNNNLTSLNINALTNNLSPQYLNNDHYQKLTNLLVSYNSSQNISKTQIYRNDYIYSTLLGLRLKPYSIGQTILKKLYQWYKQNSQEQNNNYGINATVLARVSGKWKKSKQEEDQQIRQTFKSLLPLQISTYQRKQIKQSQPTPPIFYQPISNHLQIQFLTFYNYHKQLNYQRELNQIKLLSNQIKRKKSIFAEKFTKNYYNYHPITNIFKTTFHSKFPPNQQNKNRQPSKYNNNDLKAIDAVGLMSNTNINFYKKNKQ